MANEREKQKTEWTAESSEWHVGGGGVAWAARKSQPIFPAAESNNNNDKGKGERNAVIKTTIEHSYD